jgi:hypothetical protein
MNRLLSVGEHVERPPFGRDETTVRNDQARRDEFTEALQDRLRRGGRRARGRRHDRAEFLVRILPEMHIRQCRAGTGLFEQLEPLRLPKPRLPRYRFSCR